MHAPLSRNLFDLLREMAARAPDGVAVIANDEHMSWRDLEMRARRVAAALHSFGVRRGDRVGLLLNNRAEWLEICFGAAALGAVTVPFSTWSKRSELDFLLRDSNVKVMFSLATFGEQDYAGDLASLVPALYDAAPAPIAVASYPALERVVLVGGSTLTGAYDYAVWSSAADPLADMPPPGDGACAAHDAFVLYTSGSTSYPKAVRLTHGDVIENGFNIGERQGYTSADRVLLGLPLFWSYGSANAMCATFSHGATLVLQSRFEPGGALDLIEQHACTAIYTLPAATTALVTHPSFRRERTRSLRTGLTIGSAADIETAANVLGASEICNVYGQTETYGNCCVTWHDTPLDERKQCRGPPLPGVRLRIVDPETGEPLARGRPGMIEVSGRVTAGYAGRSAELNGECMTSDGYLRTGDVGLIREDGVLQFVGRNTEMIKRAGINVAPAEVEDILRQHSGVALAGAAGVPDPERGEMIVAFVVPVPGARLTSEELRAHCRAVASSYKAPDLIEICSELPATPTGKVLRKELKARAVALMEERSAQPVRG
ncbi:class I adenylate-forming enzyme family protein [Paraburkholderia terrae]